MAKYKSVTQYATKEERDIYSKYFLEKYAVITNSLSELMKLSVSELDHFLNDSRKHNKSLENYIYNDKQVETWPTAWYDALFDAYRGNKEVIYAFEKEKRRRFVMQNGADFNKRALGLTQYVGLHDITYNNIRHGIKGVVL